MEVEVIMVMMNVIDGHNYGMTVVAVTMVVIGPNCKKHFWFHSYSSPSCSKIQKDLSEIAGWVSQTKKDMGLGHLNLWLSQISINNVCDCEFVVIKLWWLCGQIFDFFPL